MARADIFALICGFNTVVETKMARDSCGLEIKSECASIQRMEAELTLVNPYQEISFWSGMPSTHELGMIYCSHAACPVQSGSSRQLKWKRDLHCLLM